MEPAKTPRASQFKPQQSIVSNQLAFHSTTCNSSRHQSQIMLPKRPFTIWWNFISPSKSRCSPIGAPTADQVQVQSGTLHVDKPSANPVFQSLEHRCQGESGDRLQAERLQSC